MFNLSVKLMLLQETEELTEDNFLIKIPEEDLPMAVASAEEFMNYHCDKCLHKDNGCQKLFDKDGNCYQF